MANFEEKLLDMLQKKILSDISKQELISVKYDDRIQIPKNLLTEVYMSLDIETIKEKLKERLEEEMADKIANKMITEYSNDIKQINPKQSLVTVEVRKNRIVQALRKFNNPVTDEDKKAIDYFNKKFEKEKMAA